MIKKLEKKLLTKASASRKFGVSQPTLQHWIDTDRIDAVDVGYGVVMVPESSVDKGSRKPWHNERKDRIFVNN